KSPYWRQAHRHIDDSFFKHPEVKDKSNCFVCHQNFEYGIFDNALIRLP
nr:cytochrome C [Sulfurospirillum sp.]